MIGVERPGKRKVYGSTVLIQGYSAVIYSPDAPLPCGARCWVETFAPVQVFR